ncbi:hypothetical protein MIMGU_mgv1a0164902mg, partial [Erythranthe guttata]
YGTSEGIYAKQEW